jgi:hypothetical protein
MLPPLSVKPSDSPEICFCGLEVAPQFTGVIPFATELSIPSDPTLVNRISLKRKKLIHLSPPEVIRLVIARRRRLGVHFS